LGGVALDDLGQLLGDAEQVQVRLDERAHLVHALDEGDERRAARQRLDADGARPGAEVQEARARDARREHVEERLAQAVRGGPSLQRRRPLQDATAVLSGDDPHATNIKQGRAGWIERKETVNAATMNAEQERVLGAGCWVLGVLTS